ncbi:MAG: hypothetical protein QXL97_00585 [Candidatus Aenigmatarchaeota archaeon]
MSMFGGLFSGKKEVKVGKGEIPVERVKNLLDKGFSEIEIIDLLRKEGFSPEEIDKALMEALSSRSLQTQVEKTSITQQTELVSQNQQISAQQPQNIQASIQSQFQQQAFQPIASAPLSTTQQTQTKKEEAVDTQIDYVSLEEYIEYLLREKMQEINKRLMETNLRFKEFEERILGLKEEIEDLSKGSKDELNKILSEIRLNRDMVSELSIKVDTLSKTLKELLPSLIESVRLLGEIVQKLKA